MSRDYQKSKVYAAESSLHRMYDFAAEAGGYGVQVGSMALQLEPEVKFGDIAAVQAYVDKVLASDYVATTYGPQHQLKVRRRKGDRHAHYNHGVIAVHDGRNNWGMRELVVLHEIAHHFDESHTHHGGNFTQILVNLIDNMLGPQAGLALRLLYQMAEVDVGYVRSKKLQAAYELMRVMIATEEA